MPDGTVGQGLSRSLADRPTGLPIWIAGFDYAPATYCTLANAKTYWFALGRPSLVQSLPTTYDPDTAC